MHNSRVEFARMIKEFDASIVKADKSIDEMKENAKENNKKLEMIRSVVNNSESLTSELSMVNSMATKISERLENQISQARETIDSLKPEELNHNPDQKEIFTDYEEENESAADGARYRFNYSEKESSPKHMNKIGEALRRIVKDTTDSSVSTDQSGYFGSFKKINTRK